MKDAAQALFAVFAFIVVFSCLLLGAGNYWADYKCSRYSEATGRATNYVFMDDCYVRGDDQWLTLGEYSRVIVAKETFSD